jgi:hypothetical protein
MDQTKEMITGLPHRLINLAAMPPKMYQVNAHDNVASESLKRSLQDACVALKRRKVETSYQDMNHGDLEKITVGKLLRMIHGPNDIDWSRNLNANPQNKLPSTSEHDILAACNLRSQYAQMENLYNTTLSNRALASSILGVGSIGRNSSPADEAIAIARLGNLCSTASHGGPVLPPLPHSFPSSSAMVASAMEASHALRAQMLYINQSALRFAEATRLCSMARISNATSGPTLLHQNGAQSKSSSAANPKPNALDKNWGVKSNPKRPNGRFKNLYIKADEGCLSQFQCLARQQIELFEATKDDVEMGARGRNTAIVEGQVGIRCMHCANLPPLSKKRAAVYFPTKLDRVYQTAVNMATIHLCQHCEHIPPSIRNELLHLQAQKYNSGGGKRYVARGVAQLGVVEAEDGLRFAPLPAPNNDVTRSSSVARSA